VTQGRGVRNNFPPFSSISRGLGLAGDFIHQVMEPQGKLGGAISSVGGPALRLTHATKLRGEVNHESHKFHESKPQTAGIEHRQNGSRMLSYAPEPFLFMPENRVIRR
jgi:hypothetical protein